LLLGRAHRLQVRLACVALRDAEGRFLDEQLVAMIAVAVAEDEN
jgi:hypothetical protein